MQEKVFNVHIKDGIVQTTIFPWWMSTIEHIVTHTVTYYHTAYVWQEQEVSNTGQLSKIQSLRWVPKKAAGRIMQIKVCVQKKKPENCNQK